MIRIMLQMRSEPCEAGMIEEKSAGAKAICEQNLDRGVIFVYT